MPRHRAAVLSLTSKSNQDSEGSCKGKKIAPDRFLSWPHSLTLPLLTPKLDATSTQEDCRAWFRGRYPNEVHEYGRGSVQGHHGNEHDLRLLFVNSATPPWVRANFGIVLVFSLLLLHQHPQSGSALNLPPDPNYETAAFPGIL